MSAEPPGNEATLVIEHGPFVAPILSRVVGMLAARADCPIDRLDDALLLADAVAANGGAFTVNGRVTVHVAATGGVLELVVGPLRPQGAKELVAAAELPGVGNVIERFADEVRPQSGDDGGLEHLHIRLGFGPYA